MFWKKVLSAGAAAAGLLAAEPAAARGDLDWYMAGANDEQMVIVDLDSIGRNGATAWGHYVVILADTQTTDGGAAYAFMGVDGEYDCSAQRTRVTSITFRSAGNSMVDQLKADAANPEPWEDVQSGTMGGSVLEAICTPSRVDRRSMLQGTLTDLRSRYLNARNSN